MRRNAAFSLQQRLSGMFGVVRGVTLSSISKLNLYEEATVHQPVEERWDHDAVRDQFCSEFGWIIRRI